VLTDCPEIDFVVRGEGEVTAPRLIAALEAGADLATVPGIAFRRDGQPHATPPAPMLRDLDSARIGWELVDLSRHSYWGGKRGNPAILARVPASVHLLRPARFLDAMAPSRPGEIRD
jgi:hypothetical protein